MPKLNKFQQKIHAKRDARIIELAEQGYKLREIAEMIQQEYRYKISTQRVSQIINDYLQGAI